MVTARGHAARLGYLGGRLRATQGDYLLESCGALLGRMGSRLRVASARQDFEVCFLSVRFSG